MSVLILVDLSIIPQSFYIESGLIVGPPILYLLGIFTSYLLDLNFLVWSTFSPFHLTPQYKKKRVNLSVCLSTICLSVCISVCYLPVYLPTWDWAVYRPPNFSRVRILFTLLNSDPLGDGFQRLFFPSPHLNLVHHGLQVACAPSSLTIVTIPLPTGPPSYAAFPFRFLFSLHGFRIVFQALPSL